MSDDDGDITTADKTAMVQGMIALHGEITKELDQTPVDPARLMRLIAAGTNQTLVALAVLLSDGDLPTPDDPRQLGLFGAQP